MTAIERQQIGPCLSQACTHGPTVYLAGQVADDPQAGVMGQTGQILRKIDQLLEGAGTNKRGLLSATIWLSDIGTFADMNRVWDAWSRPATPRACVAAKVASPQLEGRDRGHRGGAMTKSAGAVEMIAIAPQLRSRRRNPHFRPDRGNQLDRNRRMMGKADD